MSEEKWDFMHWPEKRTPLKVTQTYNILSNIEYYTDFSEYEVGQEVTIDGFGTGKIVLNSDGKKVLQIP